MNLDKNIQSFNNVIDEVLTKIEKDNNWWFAKILKQSHFNSYSVGTGTQFGILFSYDSSNIDQTRIIAQLNPESNIETLFNDIIEQKNELEEIFDLLKALKIKNILNKFNYALGVSANKAKEDFNFYAGILFPDDEQLLINELSKTNLWFTKPSDKSVEIIQRIKTVSTLVGISKRYSKSAGHMLYYSCKKKLSRQLLEYVIRPFSEDVLENITSVLELDKVLNFANDMVFGWAVALDKYGEIQYIKLEISSGIDHLFAINNCLPLKKEYENIWDICNKNNLIAIPQLISYRIHYYEVSKTIYCKVDACYDEDLKEDISEINLDYLGKVKNYYDKISPLLLKINFTTYQAGLIANNSNNISEKESNLQLARRAKISSGKLILDAGCGLCGPSIDIASNIEGVKIEAITISKHQALIATELILKEGLSESISVKIADFHKLPFNDNHFDTVIFFESIGYSYDSKLLFAEICRVLAPGGNLYIKDVFCKEQVLNLQEKNDLENFNEIFVQYKTPTIRAVINHIIQAGFTNIIPSDLSSQISTEKFINKMFENSNGTITLSEFGKLHYHPLEKLPIYFAEISATKPVIS